MGSFLSEPGSLAFQIRATWLGMRGALNAELKAYGLSTPQYATLMILESNPGSSNSDIARACATTRQAANEMLAAFERDGLVERRPHPGDRRTHQLFLTDAGRRRLDEARVAATRWEQEAEAGFSEAERATVRKWLEGVYGACRLADEG
jgi:DNA-binding MarR family transcriptional regulator